MAKYDGTLRFDTKIDEQGFKQGAKSIERASAGLGRSLAKLGAAFAGVFAIKKLVDFTRAALAAASDLQEVQNVVETAFGHMTAKVEEFAAVSVKAFGMSELTFKQASSTFMVMSRAMGLEMERATNMSIGATARMGDIASFYNKSFEEVDTMLQGIWTGQGQALRRIGVVMTEANLQQFAYEKGIRKSIRAMTEAEKVQLRYAFVMDKTNLAAGDFVKTQDGWANQTRVLTEQWQQFAMFMGQGFIQLLTPALRMLNNLMTMMVRFAQGFSSLVSRVFGKPEVKRDAVVYDNISAGIGGAASGMEDLTEATKAARKEARRSATAFSELNIVGSSDSAGAGSVSPAIGGVGGGAMDFGDMLGIGDIEPPVIPAPDLSKFEAAAEKLKGILRRMWEPLSKIDFSPLRESLATVWESLKKFGSEHIAPGLWWIYEKVLVPLAKWTIEKFLPAFLNLFAARIEELGVIIEAMKPSLIWFWEEFLQPVAKWVGDKIIEGLEKLTKASKDFTKWAEENPKKLQLVTDAVLILAGAFALFKIGAWFIGIISKALGIFGLLVFGIKKKVLIFFDFASKAAGVFGKAIAFLTSPIGLVVLAVIALIAIVYLLIKHWDTVKEVAAKAWEFIKAAWASAGEWFKNKVVDPIVSFFTAGWDLLKSAGSSAWEFLKGIWTAAAGWFKQMVTDPISNAFQNMGDKLTSIFTNVRDGLKGLLNANITMFESFINAIIGGIGTGLIGALNKINLKAPDWLPGIGGRSFGFNLQAPQKIQLPKLATGAVIPPGREFAAILGDQRHGNNLEAPEGLIRQIVREETGNQAVTLNITGGDSIGREFARILNDSIRREQRLQGRRIVVGGAV